MNTSNYDIGNPIHLHPYRWNVIVDHEDGRREVFPFRDEHRAHCYGLLLKRTCHTVAEVTIKYITGRESPFSEN